MINYGLIEDSIGALHLDRTTFHRDRAKGTINIEDISFTNAMSERGPPRIDRMTTIGEWPEIQIMSRICNNMSSRMTEFTSSSPSILRQGS